MKIFHFYLNLMLILKPELFEFLPRNRVSDIKKAPDSNRIRG
ncbi:hypothetical protein Aconfl_30630 [Algoriphagus confluentis]|uniref:Uncharacterized protein n=1 Tax=Algoriphagus confluentis TaxID=1697556 RepID=A0ABQ6PT27_9BACT|nr:hypothetical protein Aconfl_30630 [Algoriphagus confluentis]